MWSPPRVALTAAATLLALGLGGCVGGSENERSAPEPSPSPASTGPAQSLRERAAPYDLGLRRVAGGLPEKERQRYLKSVTRPVRAWVDAGFVDGPWPREGFAAAFRPFTRGVGAAARRDAGLLTLHADASALVDVVPERRRIRVSITSPHDRAIGATARVDLRLAGLTRTGERRQYNVRGDLYLTRPDARGWQIFGYRLDRWVDRGAMAQGGG